MKRLGSRLGNKFRRPCRSLPEEVAKVPLSPHLFAHSGIPIEADSLAYEPVQRLLAVGTSDGRLKLVGAYGVEKLLQTHNSEGTRQLFFLTNRGTLMRLDKPGGLEAWGVDTGQLISRLELAGDRITTACPLPGEPYIMLGCWSGSLRVACLEDSLGEPTSEAREIKGMHVLEYAVPASSLGASGPLISCSVSISDEGPLLLAHHAASGVVVWNIRREKVVLRVDPIANDKLRRYGSVSATCWANHMYESRFVATGHESGELFVWRIPDKPDGEEECTPEMVHQTRAPPKGVSASRISSLSFVSGQTDGVLAMGGQRNSDPDALIRFSVPTKESNSDTNDTDNEHHSFPWFGLVIGHVLIPPNGSLEENDDPVAILVLAEGGILMLHNFESQESIPLCLPFQNISQPTVSHFATIKNDSSSFGAFRKSLTEKPWDGCDLLTGGSSPLCKWVLSGGEAPSTASTSQSPVYFCGHSDGLLRLWDFSCETPRGLGLVRPPDNAESVHTESPVSALAIAAHGNFLAVGHEEGRTNLYRFSENAREVKVRVLNLADDSVDISILKVAQDPGHQLILAAVLGAGTVTALSFSSSLAYLAIGDDRGNVSVIDLAVPCAKFRFLLGSSALHNLCFGQTNETSRTTGEDLLYATCLDSSLAIISMTTGKMTSPSGGWVRPKTSSASILTVVLDSSGYPIQPRATLVDIPWLLEKSYSKPCLSLSSAVTTNSPMDQTPDNQARPQCEITPASSESELSEARSSNSADLQSAAVSKIDETIDQTNPEEKADAPPAATRVGSWAHGRRRRKSREQPLHKKTVGAPDPQHQVIPEEVEADNDTNEGRARSESDRESPSSMESGDRHNYVLLVTDLFVRIYSIESVLHGDRSSLQKLVLPSPLVFATIVTDPNTHAVALATISTSHALQVYSIPSLELMEDIPLEDILGWNFDPLLDGEQISNYSCIFSADSFGQVLLHGLSGEMSRISLVYGTSQIHVPNRTYDWELAAAAHSARRAALHRTNSNTSEADVAGQDKLGETLKKGFGTLLGVAKKARDEFDKAMHLQQPKPTEDSVAPSLFALFKVEESRKHLKSEIPLQSDVGEEEALPAVHSEESTATLAKRDELLAGARVPENSDAKVRTADEIREAYGRPRKQKDSTGKVRSIMGENMKQLDDRGRKIKSLDDKTADMADDAANFASLAKQLADQQKNKKWWQL